MKLVIAIPTVLGLLLQAPALAAPPTDERVSETASGAEPNGDSSEPDIAGNEKVVVFTSYASNLVPDDENNATDVFVRDLDAGTTERISVRTDGSEGWGRDDSGWPPLSWHPEISDDGRFVVFQSRASLVEEDDDVYRDIYLRDRESDITYWVTPPNTSVEWPHSGGYDPTISGNGRYVAYSAGEQIFLWDRETGDREIISRSFYGDLGNDESRGPSLSRNGSKVAFISKASNFDWRADGLPAAPYLYDRIKDELQYLDYEGRGPPMVGGNGARAGTEVSANGKRVVYWSSGENSSGHWRREVISYSTKDEMSRVTSWSWLNNATIYPDDFAAGSYDPQVSATGRFIIYDSDGKDLVGPYVNEYSRDVYVYDWALDETFRIMSSARETDISDDGSFFVATTDQQLVPDDEGASRDVYLRGPLPTEDPPPRLPSGIKGFKGPGPYRNERGNKLYGALRLRNERKKEAVVRCELLVYEDPDDMGQFHKDPRTDIIRGFDTLQRRVPAGESRLMRYNIKHTSRADYLSVRRCWLV